MTDGMLENVVFDDHGRLLTASYMDYALPRADDLVMHQIERAAIQANKSSVLAE